MLAYKKWNLQLGKRIEIKVKEIGEEKVSNNDGVLVKNEKGRSNHCVCFNRSMLKWPAHHRFFLHGTRGDDGDGEELKGSGFSLLASQYV